MEYAQLLGEPQSMARQECSTKITAVRMTYSLTEERVIIIPTGRWNRPSSFVPWFGNRELRETLQLGTESDAGHRNLAWQCVC